MTGDAVLEILTLTIKPGMRDAFHRIYIAESLPLLKKWRIDVVDHGPSLHDEVSYYVVRRFKDLEQRQKLEDDFYESDDWRKGPRERILGMIETMSTIVIKEEALRVWLGKEVKA